MDTNICVFLFRQHQVLNRKLDEINIENCFISEVTQLELEYGAECSNDPSKHKQTIHSFLKKVQIIPISACFTVFAKEKARLRNEGLLISDFDLLIGSTAIAANLILVTDNTKHFNRIQNIQLENWVNR